MSTDKHRKADLKRFVLANLPLVHGGAKIYVRLPAPGPRLAPYPKVHKRAQWRHTNAHSRGRWIEVSAEVRELERAGKIKRKRFYAFRPFGSCLGRTRLVRAEL